MKPYRRNLSDRVVEALTRRWRERQLRHLKRLGLLTVGPHSTVRLRLIAYPGETGQVRIGSYVSIAHEASFILGGNHHTGWVTTAPIGLKLGLPNATSEWHPQTKGDIEVGHDVWIGYGATILSGVRIGDGAVIGARAVVAKSVRPYAIVVGNPAVEVGRRFDDETVSKLERIQWWKWPEADVRARVPLLCSDDIQGFLERFSAEP